MKPQVSLKWRAVFRVGEEGLEGGIVADFVPSRVDLEHRDGEAAGDEEELGEKVTALAGAGVGIGDAGRGKRSTFIGELSTFKFGGLMGCVERRFSSAVFGG